MAAPSVITIIDAKLVLADTEAELALGGEDFSCQVAQAAINAEANLQDVPATFCAPAGQVAASSGYTLAVTWLQDWNLPSGGLSGYAFTNDAQQKWFQLQITASDGTTAPVATGQITLVAGAFGGEAGVPLQSEAEWPILGKPSITLPTAAP